MSMSLSCLSATGGFGQVESLPGVVPKYSCGSLPNEAKTPVQFVWWGIFGK